VGLIAVHEDQTLTGRRLESRSAGGVQPDAARFPRRPPGRV